MLLIQLIGEVKLNGDQMYLSPFVSIYHYSQFLIMLAMEAKSKA